MSLIAMAGILQASSASDVVTVSGELVAHSVSNGNTARAGVRVNTDGTLDKLVGTTYTQVDASTDWVIPNSYSGSYHVKFTKGFFDSAPNYNPDSVSLDTWYAISATSYRLGYEESTDDTENSGTITIHISDDGGSTTLDSGAYNCQAIVGFPIT